MKIHNERMNKYALKFFNNKKRLIDFFSVYFQCGYILTSEKYDFLIVGIHVYLDLHTHREICFVFMF